MNIIYGSINIKQGCKIIETINNFLLAILKGNLLYNLSLSPKKSHILDLSIKSPYFHYVFGPSFTPYPLSQWYLQKQFSYIKSRYEMLKLNF